MIEALKLINFKCFNDKYIKLNNLSILTGANAVGKSSIIQALILIDYSNFIMQNQGPRYQDAVLDVNQIFSISVGAPSALISQNPLEGTSFDFELSVLENEQWQEYQYKVDKSSPLDLKIVKASESASLGLQYLNAERIGPRISNIAGLQSITNSKAKISYDGGNALYMVEIADKSNRKIALLLQDSSDKSDKFSYQVEKWMSAILGDMQLEIKVDYTKATTEMRIKNSTVDIGVVPTLTGFGISYILPIIVAGLWCSGQRDTVLIIENPEAHLHPFAQSNIGKFLALIAESGVQVIVETHSEHIIDGARVQMTCDEQADRMVVNFLENVDGKIESTSIQLKANGELSAWPRGFFDQKQLDLRTLMKLRRENGNK